MSKIDTLLEMGDGNEYRQAGNGEPGIRAQAARGKQAGFSTSVELAVSFIHRQIEWPEETMELTLPPGPHETVEKQDPVHAWRAARLARLGISPPVAEAAAGHVDWHQMAALVQRGCPPWLALRILR
jgi:hypothetical protein